MRFAATDFTRYCGCVTPPVMHEVQLGKIKNELWKSMASPNESLASKIDVAVGVACPLPDVAIAVCGLLVTVYVNGLDVEQFTMGIAVFGA